MTHVTGRLTAKNWDQLQNPMLGNRVWASIAFYPESMPRIFPYVTLITVFFDNCIIKMTRVVT